MALTAGALCTVLFGIRWARLLRSGAPKDLSKASGSVAKGVAYSCTVAMLPKNKESARLHLPTFIAGLLFHAGVFLSLSVFAWSILTAVFGWPTPHVAAYGGTVVLLAGAHGGMAMLCKRIFKKELRSLSCADDYISNGLATLFQFAAAGYLLHSQAMALPYYALATLLFLWLPIGKTRHLLYFFAARFHLGFFYGRRGTWPPSQTPLPSPLTPDSSRPHDNPGTKK